MVLCMNNVHFFQNFTLSLNFWMWGVSKLGEMKLWNYCLQLSSVFLPLVLLYMTMCVARNYSYERGGVVVSSEYQRSYLTELLRKCIRWAQQTKKRETDRFSQEDKNPVRGGGGGVLFTAHLADDGWIDCKGADSSLIFMGEHGWCSLMSDFFKESLRNFFVAGS